ncbi:MAG: hypothetical protein JST64_11455 [Actinobacteria bacterium]|nr:hypothetical protein [Actinomycetota bacterium]
MEQLTAHYQRQEDLLWRAFVEESPEIHAAGRSLSAVQEQLRSAIFEQGHRDPTIIDLVDLPDSSRDAVAEATQARADVAALTERSAELTRHAAQALVKDGLSLRDVATVLGLSHTRVQQLLRDSVRPDDPPESQP